MATIIAVSHLLIHCIRPMHGPLKDLPEKTIIQRYRNGESIKSLASEHRISPTTIKKRLILRNVAVRTLKA